MQRETDLPDPFGVGPVQGPRLVRRLIVLAVLVGLTIAAFKLPLPMFYAYVPGPVRDVELLVDVEGAQTYVSEGELYLTTVSVDLSVTFADAVGALIDAHEQIVMKEQVTQGRSIEELEREQLAEMARSKRAAEEVVLTTLGLAHPTGDGAEVTQIIVDSPADGRIEPGDLILEIDGRPVATSCDVGRRINEREVGEEVEVTLRRSGRLRTLTVPTVASSENPQEPLIGVFMRDRNRSFDSGIDVAFKTGRIAGPSAGLMFSLALYDRLTPDDLTEGRAIAGTGTIACDGGVGAIGGIEQKVAGAEAAGAEVFLAPAGNYEVARRAADDMEVVSISRFADALEYLTSSG